MTIFVNSDTRVIVQGMTGAEGRKHTQRMLSSGTTIVGGTNPRKAGTTVTFDVQGYGPDPRLWHGRRGPRGHRRERLRYLRAPGLREGRRPRGYRGGY